MRKAFAIPAIGLAFVLGIGVAGASDSERPTPTPQIVEVPGPERTIEIEVPGDIVEVPGPERLIERVPPACVRAFDALNENYLASLNFGIQIMSDYLDYPDENLLEFGQRVERSLMDYADTRADFAEIDYSACR